MDLRRVLLFLYARLLTLFPGGFRAEFGEEMQGAFADLLQESAGRGRAALLNVGLRELLQAPAALLGAYRFSSRYVLPRPDDADSLALLPPGPDGRDSWPRAGLETLPFLLAGGVLLLLAYLPPAWVGAGWQRAWAAGGAPAAALATAGLLLGLHRGVPRWTYAFGGLLLGCVVTGAQRTGLLPVVASLPPVALALLAATGLARSLSRGRRQPSAPALMRLMTNPWDDPLRLSFGIYGALPLVIVMAYDDGLANDRTACLAFSVFVMAAGALVYARSRRPAWQAFALLAAMSLAVWASALDRLLGGSVARTAMLAGFGWRLQVWAIASALLLGPALLTVIRHTKSRPEVG